MAEIEFTLLDKEIDDFICGNSSIEKMVMNAYYQTILQHGYAYKFCTKSGLALGYYMIRFEKVLIAKCEEAVNGCYDENLSNYYSIHIHFLAVDEKYQKHKIGTSVLNVLVKNIRNLAKIWPIRLITIDALKEKYAWYIKNGFLPFNEKDLENDSSVVCMYIDCLTDDNKERMEKYFEERSV